MAAQRHRKRTWNLEHKKDEIHPLVKRALDFARDDESNRQIELDMSLQRYAKFRQWRDEANDALWENSADAAVADLMTLSLRTQDTIHNAILNSRPALESSAVQEKDLNKQDGVDEILDYQLLEENGKQWLGDAIDHFTNDGHATALVVWVDESRLTTETLTVDPIPEEISPGEHFQRVLTQLFGQDGTFAPSRNVVNSWDWTVGIEGEDTDIFASFYTDTDGTLELDISKQTPRFHGPKVITKQRSQVLTAVAVENLQMPGPSNPQGAGHVILVDRPSILEIKELHSTGAYDELTDQDIKDLENTESWEENLQEQQKNIIGGESDMPTKGPEDHKRVTRLLVFDVMDLGRGPEDVVYWVIKEIKALAKKRRLFEAFPSRVPRRPLAEGQMIPIPGRRTGIGMLEIAEGLHDIRKQITDQVINLGNMMLSPWFFYRPSGVMKPEIIKLWPGEGYPLNDPKNDVFFPKIDAQGMSYGLNMLALNQQDQERVSMVSDLSLGRVPAGKASALRTVGGIERIVAQGDARPERIMRRFSEFMAQIWLQAHELNRTFLDKGKAFRIAFPVDPNKDPYREVQAKDLDATMEFTFSAGVLNTSKEALQQSLGQLMSIYLSEIGVMTGVTTPNTVYSLFRDFAKSLGQDPNKYIQPPEGRETITFQEALLEIMDGRLPKGFPAEGPEQHLTMLAEFFEDEQFAFLSPEAVEVFKEWTVQVQGILAQLQEQQQLAQAAEQLQAGGRPGGGSDGGAGGGQPQNPQPASPGPNELIDKSLPVGAGGGGALV
mgnify:CR=1 FL=1